MTSRGRGHSNTAIHVILCRSSTEALRATSLEGPRAAQDFDCACLEQMIAHHRMGVMKAFHAQRNTQHHKLQQLEATMVRVQSEQIAHKKQWYRQW